MTYISPSLTSTIRHHATGVVIRPVLRPTDVGLAILRVVTGAVFLMHGWQKVFDVGFAGVRGQMGIPAPEITAPLVAFVELLGGAALILGGLARCFALALAVNMLGAIWFVHLPAGFFLPNGYEFAVTLLGAMLALLLIGPGYLSVDGAIARRRFPAAVVYPREEPVTVAGP